MRTTVAAGDISTQERSRLRQTLSSAAMDASQPTLASRFLWPQVLLRTLASTLGPSLPRSLLCQSGGSDSDFTGGACAWEHACRMLEAASMEILPRPEWLDLLPRTTCDACLRYRCLSPCHNGAHPVFEYCLLKFHGFSCDAQELDPAMRLCANFHLPEDVCQFGNILEIWGCPDLAATTLQNLGSYEERVGAAHNWPTQATGYCYRHDQQCPYARSHLRVQGPPCPDYSLCGRRKGTDGPTFPALLAAGAKARLAGSSLVIVENVPGLPMEVVQDVYGDAYDCTAVMLDPAHAGFDCVARPRTRECLFRGENLAKWP